MTFIRDLPHAVDGGVSIAPGTEIEGAGSDLLGSVDGVGVDCLHYAGKINAEVSVGDADDDSSSVGPEEYEVEFKLQESDTLGGQYEDLVVQDKVVLTEDATRGMVSGHRAKRFVRVVASADFETGESPKIAVSANVIGTPEFTPAE